MNESRSGNTIEPGCKTRFIWFLCVIIAEGRRKKEEGRRKKEEGRSSNSNGFSD
jgi:hypothetical protein